MNARIKKLWVAALRSGKWIKGRGQLRYEDSRRCCLGVLCEVYIEDTLRGKWRGNRFINDHDGVSSTGMLTPDLLDWAGMDQEDGDAVVIKHTKTTLVGHNDGTRGMEISHAEIATAIEDQL